ncbi:MAG: hypothetical protein B7Z72_03055, partial [Gemmatimonadetes bacterium 21-71-4]
MANANSFGTRALLQVGDRAYQIHRLATLEKAGYTVSRLPYSLRILLESLLRFEDGLSVKRGDVDALARWNPEAAPAHEIAFMPSRVLLQDFTGVPAVVDLAAMRDAMRRLGGDPRKINPLLPAELVIDHSVQVDAFGTPAAFQVNADLEFERNRERYAFLRWGQKAFRNFRVVPPDTGIVHQVNLEYLARVVFSTEGDKPEAYPDTLVGTDSHTTMVNGLGVLGWGVGGIEAEAAMLGQPMTMLIPQVIGFRLTGRLAEGATATDLVLTVTEMLRKKGVVGKFVEFYGPGVSTLPIADRATIGNMAPEYGATCGIFPVDDEALRYLRFTGRKQRGGVVEVLIERIVSAHRARVQLRASKVPKTGSLIRLDGGLEARVCERNQGFFELELEGATWPEACARFGHVPLPPYIRRSDRPADSERYQTVFARTPGAVAAPTAGLHFDEPLLL